MALTHHIIKHIDLEHEPGQWIEVRMPSLAILDKARDERSRKALAMVQGVDLSQLKDFTIGQTIQADSDCDWQTLLNECITAWSYEDDLTAENIAELDKITVDVVISILLPSETEEDRKKG